jgi:hypothetical protein
MMGWNVLESGDFMTIYDSFDPAVTTDASFEFEIRIVKPSCENRL